MAGTKAGGKKAAIKNKANNPNYYAEIGSKGGKNGNTGGFGANIFHFCSELAGEHKTSQCAGARGGRNRRGWRKEV